MTAQPLGNTPSFAGQFLKEYRKQHHLSQEQLAFDLHMEPRTLRAYENGERQLNNIHELRRIADLLGIIPEHLGVAASIYAPHTPDQIEEVVERVWALMHDLRISEAKTILDALLRDTDYRATSDDPIMLLAFAHLSHVAGYVASMSGRTMDVPRAIRYYHDLEVIARHLNEQTLLNTALAYQGDMYRRIGEREKAITYLEAARDTTPLADLAARGNAIQLLGRAYLAGKNLSGFNRAMAQAEELAHQINAQENSIHGHFNLGTVYEEYAKSYTALKQAQKALDYVELTNATLPKTKNNEMLLMIIRAEVLIHSGEIEAGKTLAVGAARLSQAQGHQRRLERISKLKRYLREQSSKLTQAEMELAEALEGPLEQ